MTTPKYSPEELALVRPEIARFAEDGWLRVENDGARTDLVTGAVVKPYPKEED